MNRRQTELEGRKRRERERGGEREREEGKRRLGQSITVCATTLSRRGLKMLLL